MLNLTPKEVRQMIQGYETKIANTKTGLDRINSEIQNLTKQKETTNAAISKMKNKLKAAQKALILTKGVSKKVSQKRNRVIRTIEQRVQAKTREEKNELNSEINRLKTELRAMCPHPFVLNISGSGETIYESYHLAFRYCFVCGFKETSNERPDTMIPRLDGIFETLIPNKKRIITNNASYREYWETPYIWIPLGALLKPLEKAVAENLN